MIERVIPRMPAPSLRLLKAFSSINGTITPPIHPALRIQRHPASPSRRRYATSPIPPPEPLSVVEAQQQTSAPPPPPPPPSSKKSLSFRPLIWAATGIILGMLSGNFVTLMITPPPLPSPHSAADQLLSADIQSRASKLAIVQELSSSPDWESWDAYSGFDEKRREHNFTARLLEGARAIGAYSRIWWNKETGEVVQVLWIGGSVGGWPGVTHGGLLATVLDEGLGRCAMIPRNSGVFTANLNITYRNPTPTNSFYVLRIWPVIEGSTARKAFVAGRLEDLNGKVCVEASGLFIVPKNTNTEQAQQNNFNRF